MCFRSFVPIDSSPFSFHYTDCFSVRQIGYGGNPVTFLLSAGNDHDSTHAIQLLEQVNISGSSVLADRAYGSASIRTYIGEHGASYVIPPKNNVSDPWPVDWHLYKERHLVECFFQKIKWFRRIATRYDKLDASFLAFVYLAAIAILLI